MRKTLLSLCCVLLVMGLILTGCASSKPATDSKPAEQPAEKPAAEAKTFKIGISQFVEHPALDAARKGFIDGMKELGYEEGKNVEYLVENAQADSATCQTIANKFKQDKVDLILAIATPNAQAAANVVKDIPIVITAVTDPVSAGLAESLEKPGKNITGTTDMNPVEEQVALVKKILPDAKKLGVLYNAGEVNSVVQVDIVKQAAQKLGLELVEATASNASEVNQAAASLAGKVDAVYVPTDNTVASAISSVVKVTNRAKIPLIGSERGQVDQGGIATLGIDYYLLGKQTAEAADKILKGGNPADIPITGSRDLKLIINKKAADAIGLEIPKELLSSADEVIQ